MRRLIIFSQIITFAIALLGTVACPPGFHDIAFAHVQEQKHQTIKSINVKDLEDRTQVIVRSEGPLTYTTFTLSEPPRLIIDLPQVSLAGSKEPLIVNKGVIKEIYPIESDIPARVVRINIKLTDEGLKHKIYQEDEGIVIDIFKKKASGNINSPSPPEKTSEASHKQEAQKEAKKETSPPEKAAVLPSKKDLKAAPADTKGNIKNNNQQNKENNEEEKLDTENAEKGSRKSLQSGAVQDKKEVSGKVKGHALESQEGVHEEKGVIKNIVFHATDDVSEVLIEANKKLEFRYFKLKHRIVLDIFNASYGLLKTRIPVQESDVISRIRVGFHREPRKKIRVVLDLKKDVAYKIHPVDNKGLKVTIIAKEKTKKAEVPLITTREEKMRVPQEKPAKKEVQVTKPSKQALPVHKKYTGKKISLDFQDADIVNVLRLIAEVSRLNIVIGDDVKGKITMKMMNVPWDQALDVILHMKGLGKVYEDNVLRIDTLANIARQQEAEAKAKEAMVQAKDLVTKIFPVNYAKAADIARALTKSLSHRGSITVDDRTNTLIVKDIEDKQMEIAKLLKTLDKPTPQVLIEARIVQADSNFARDLGIQWGGNYMSTPGNYNIGIFTGPSGTIGSPSTGFAVNLPAAGVAGTKGSIGFTIGKTVGDSLNLDLRLSAGEAKGLTKVLSAPKIATLDNKEATITQGEAIPYKTVSQEGTKTEFIDATLTLKVTPKITPDGHIAMKIKITKNRQGSIVVEGTPSINKKEATTEVLVKNGETTVIGGIYEITNVDNMSAIPWFHKIPLLGWLFKSTQKSNIKSELLIFITPKIISPASGA